MTPGRQIYLEAYAPPPAPPSRWQEMVGIVWPAEVAQGARRLLTEQERSNKYQGSHLRLSSSQDHNDPCSNKGSEDQRPYEDERPRHSSDYVTSEDPLPNTEGRQPGPQDEWRSNQHYKYIYTK
ncbi:hypothetical protein ACLKA6_016148 [Drosophila palustris]